MTTEQNRLDETGEQKSLWKKWGPYLSERQWGTVREDYSENGDAWNFFTHDQARSRAYRWGEDGLAGIWQGPQGEALVVAVNYAAHQSQCHVRLPFAGLAGKKWQLQDQLSSGSYEWNGDDLQGKGLYLDMTPWQACVFSLVQCV